MRPRHSAGEYLGIRVAKLLDLDRFNEAPAFSRGILRRIAGSITPPASFNEAPAFSRGILCISMYLTFGQEGLQ